MEERNLNDGLKQEVNKLKTQVQRLNTIVWVVGIIAVIFGITGSWGYSILSETRINLKTTQNDLETTQNDLQTAKKDLESLEEKAADLRKELEEKAIKLKKVLKSELDEYSEDTKNKLDKHFKDEKKKLESKLNSHFYAKEVDFDKRYNKCVKYNEKVAFRMTDPVHKNKLLSGGGKVRTGTPKIGPDEKWKIERAP